MTKINSVIGREILDSRGNPTLEVELTLSNAQSVRAAVPSGASTGAHEAVELRDKDPKRYGGKGVLQAVQNVRELAWPIVVGRSPEDWKQLDQAMIEADGTPNKQKFGANTILGVSLACAKAAALVRGEPLYSYLSESKDFKLPVPLMNILNGGAHANNGLDVQEFMIAPICGGSFRESLRAGSEIFQTLKKLLDQDGHSTAVGDEGGFAPRLKSNEEALNYVMRAIEKAGYKPGADVMLALDVAATELYKNGKYTWEKKTIEPEQLIDVYSGWVKNFPLVSIEDGLSEDDWTSWVSITKKIGQKVQLIGDDLFVTNFTRLERGVREGAANAILVKVNQIGSLSETQKTVDTAKANGFRSIMSHRSGETEDVTIADLAVGLNCEQIKTGSLCRGERTAKYNQLLRIEESLGSKQQYWGRTAFAALT